MHSDGLAGKTETFVRYGVTPRLEIGVGYLWKQSVARPLATYTFLRETPTRPALTGGLLLDSLGGGRQGVFASVAKDLQRSTGVPLSVYVGAAQVSNERKLRALAGGNLRLFKRAERVGSVRWTLCERWRGRQDRDGGRAARARRDCGRAGKSSRAARVHPDSAGKAKKVKRCEDQRSG